MEWSIVFLMVTSTLALKYVKPLVLNSMEDVDEIERVYINGGSGLLSKDLGLSGFNQIVGLAVSGINLNHPYFGNTNGIRRFAFQNDPSDEDILESKLNTEKFIQYIQVGPSPRIELADRKQASIPASIIVGSNSNQIEYEGFATDARLALIDVFDDDTDELYLPDTFNGAFFDYSYKVGARIFCNAWAEIPDLVKESSSTNNYTEMSFQIDSYAYDHQDFLIIIPSGFALCPEGPSINSFANSKNSLVVGSTFSLRKPIEEYLFDSANVPLNDLSDDLSSLELLRDAAINSTFCRGLFTPSGPAKDSRTKPDIYVPGELIIGANGNYVIGEGFGIVAELNVQTLRNSRYTSSASAVTAGVAALVREYLTEKRQERMESPSSALMKSILISASIQAPINRQVYQVSASDCNPAALFDRRNNRNYLGFGDLRLNTTIPMGENYLLYFPGHDESLTSSFGDPALSQTGDFKVFEYCAFHDRDAEDTKIVLVWNDPPQQNESLKQLVNDLDLTVEYDDRVYLGNAQYLQTSGNDRLNNVEVVSLPKASSSEGKIDIRIVINAFQMQNISSPQAFALTMTGFVAVGDCSIATRPFLSEETVEEQTSDFSSSLGVLFWIFIAILGTIFLCNFVCLRMMCTCCCMHFSAYKDYKEAKLDDIVDNSFSSEA